MPNDEREQLFSDWLDSALDAQLAEAGDYFDMPDGGPI